MGDHPVGSTPLVTWMIPVLNGMPYIRQTLESIQNQTFKNYQVAVWDNGSTDGTVEELRQWIPARLPGRIVSNRPMLLGLARAAMVAECDTELAALIDADDINHPDRLEKQVAFLQDHPEVAAVGTQLNRIDAAGVNHGRLTHYPIDHEQIVQEMLLTNPIGQPSVLFRRSAVAAVGNYHDFSPTHVEDYDLWLRLAAAGHRLANLDLALVDYRVHEQSTTQQSIKARRLDEEMIRRLAENSPALFGCDASVMTQLKMRQHPCAIVPLKEIAEQASLGARPWKSPVFYNAARQMFADRDLRSRLSAARRYGGLSAGLKELSAIGLDLARYMKRKIMSGHTSRGS